MRIKNKSQFAVRVFLQLNNSKWGETRDLGLPDSDLSDTTEWRVLNDLQEAGLIEQRRKGKWKLTEKGQELI